MISFALSLPGFRIFKLSIVVVFLSLSALLGGAITAQAQQASQVKAAFLFNFAKFVEWPPGAFVNDQAAIILCFSDRDPMAEALEALRGKVVQGRRLEIRRCRGPEDFRGCQIFFASASERAGLPQIIGSLRNSPVLTVTEEVDNFAKLGGIINLIVAEGKIRFEISLHNARRPGLKISSQLLKLAKTVEE
jgi:hypothetical protein